MFNQILRTTIFGFIIFVAFMTVFGQTSLTVKDVPLDRTYGRYRANNDLLFYHLDVRVEPAKKHLSGKNTIRFKMLEDDNRIQIDLHPALNIDKITLAN